jgi:hypothetical protein
MLLLALVLDCFAFDLGFVSDRSLRVLGARLAYLGGGVASEGADSALGSACSLVHVGADSGGVTVRHCCDECR